MGTTETQSARGLLYLTVGERYLRLKESGQHQAASKLHRQMVEWDLWLGQQLHAVASVRVASP